MQKQPIFALKNGDLSAYSFACGYVQTEYYNHAEVQIYHDGCYHVELIAVYKCTPYVGCLGIETDEKRERVICDNFESLTEARKRFSELKQTAKKDYK